MAERTDGGSGHIGVADLVRRPAVIGALLWWFGLAIEYPFGLFPPGDGSLLYFFNAGTFVAALVAWMVAVVRWRRGQASGPGRLAAWGFGIWVIGLGMIVIATVFRVEAVGVLFPLGGVGIMLGGALVAVASLRADELALGQRLALIQLGLAWLVIYLLLNVVILGREDPTWWIEALLGLSWFVAGMTVSDRRVRTPDPAA